MVYILNGLGSVSKTVPAGWVPTKLRSGDQLGNTNPDKSLDKLYKLSAKEIAEANGAVFNTPAINTWVLRTGGTMLPSGFAAFTNNSVIFLPANGARLPATAPAAAPPPAPPMVTPPVVVLPTLPPLPKPKKGFDGTTLAIGVGFFALAGFWVFGKKKPKSASSSSAVKKTSWTTAL